MKNPMRGNKDVNSNLATSEFIICQRYDSFHQITPKELAFHLTVAHIFQRDVLLESVFN